MKIMTLVCEYYVPEKEPPNPHRHVSVWYDEELKGRIRESCWLYTNWKPQELPHLQTMLREFNRRVR